MYSETIMQKMSKQKCQPQGMTLIELLIVIGILAIMAGMTMSALGEYIPEYRLNAAVRELATDLQNAKTEAIKRNAYIVVVFSPGIYSPEGEIGSYFMFVDDGKGGGVSANFTHDGDEEVITNKTMPKNVSLYSSGFTTINSTNNRILFNSLGLPNIKVSNKFIFGNVKLRNNKSKYYKISTSMYGGLRIIESNNGTFS